MLKLRIINKINFQYRLQDQYGKKYSLNLEFYDINKKPDIGDYLYINRKLLDSEYKGFCDLYAFGDLRK